MYKNKYWKAGVLQVYMVYWPGQFLTIIDYHFLDLTFEILCSVIGLEGRGYHVGALKHRDSFGKVKLKK